MHQFDFTLSHLVTTALGEVAVAAAEWLPWAVRRADIKPLEAGKYARKPAECLTLAAERRYSIRADLARTALDFLPTMSKRAVGLLIERRPASWAPLSEIEIIFAQVIGLTPGDLKGEAKGADSIIDAILLHQLDAIAPRTPPWARLSEITDPEHKTMIEELGDGKSHDPQPGRPTMPWWIDEDFGDLEYWDGNPGRCDYAGAVAEATAELGPMLTGLSLAGASHDTQMDVAELYEVADTAERKALAADLQHRWIAADLAANISGSEMRLAIDMLGMTVTEAAEMLEIEPRQMHRLIAGTTPVSREHAARWLQRVGDIGHAAREANRVEEQ
jgi:hypothetical protein